MVVWQSLREMVNDLFINLTGGLGSNFSNFFVIWFRTRMQVHWVASVISEFLYLIWVFSGLSLMSPIFVSFSFY